MPVQACIFVALLDSAEEEKHQPTAKLLIASGAARGQTIKARASR